MDKCPKCGSPIFEKSCCNCGNRKNITYGKFKDSHFFFCSFLNLKVEKLNLFYGDKAEKCGGWVHNCQK